VGRLGSYTWGIFITALAGPLAIPLFLMALRRYPCDLNRIHLSNKEQA
jgi:hypothetical protein